MKITYTCIEECWFHNRLYGVGDTYITTNEHEDVPRWFEKTSQEKSPTGKKPKSEGTKEGSAKQ